MNRTTVTALTLALALVFGLVCPFVSPAAADTEDADTLTLGPNIPLNHADQLSRFNETGKVSVQIADPQMEIELSDDRGGVGLGISLNPLEGSTRNEFVRITHKEGIERTVRIPIRAEYWNPYPREELSSLDSEHTANLKPVELNGEEYTMITVRFDGEESAVFPIPEDAAAVYSASERTEERANSTFGWSLGLTETPWTNIRQDVWNENNTTVRVEGNPDEILVQYNDGTAADPVWLTVPDQPRRGVPVYVMEKDGVDGAVYLVSTTSESPQVRFKTESTTMDQVSAAVRDARRLPDRILRNFGVDTPGFSLFGDSSTFVSSSALAGGR